MCEERETLSLIKRLHFTHENILPKIMCRKIETYMICSRLVFCGLKKRKKKSHKSQQWSQERVSKYALFIVWECNKFFRNYWNLRFFRIHFIPEVFSREAKYANQVYCVIPGRERWLGENWMPLQFKQFTLVWLWHWINTGYKREARIIC